MILIVDNFDSFTYNLVDYFNQLGEECEVIRNDVAPEKLNKRKYSAVVLSPGPGKPEEAGFLMDYIESFENELPILGICLGHQAIAKHHGIDVIKAIRPMHGKLSRVHLLLDDELFQGINQNFQAVRYHSLVVGSLEDTILLPLANTQENENMIFKHQLLPIYGIQYHPEAALTEHGLKILSNWNSLVKQKSQAIENKL
ncbi:glutamine amidotransferase [Marivirga tractuosa]|uniref:Glutamine amidotransferase of anthranilate synthase n=1 Tax=Marivirga tractuosa (strain ATCC 23168 / DSM 4126 / NBRC 15989 / NCIMB 1408 / VKM B-1430 / H-43) TaxID=643867 RepID=E4TS29_MARTH|nr:aminodeoxychorismate/anthranilate synthase component II [Marivirga tractuosa]ADR21769.1 glutamine amidotransferase of anthranilate synthase [Marivirga tractuosa DSM 4126]BDD13773.1 glutamine amidotransferase [Marivirga tractuosa]